MAIYELRQYKVLDGQMENWLKVMQEEIIPFQVAQGMVITASFRGEENDNIYVWIRRFESEKQREDLYRAVYESDVWKNEISPRLSTLLDREAMIVTRLAPTAMSILQ
ncbi:MAG: NIPSNAP family protein [Pseudomonadota bacterium]|nr:NIPSNAP family protein [Pseudomonadota bacterium]